MNSPALIHIRVLPDPCSSQNSAANPRNFALYSELYGVQKVYHGFVIVKLLTPHVHIL